MAGAVEGRNTDRAGATQHILPLRRPARVGDPETSHQAACELEASGALAASMLRVLRLLAAHKGPAPTSAELAGADVRLRYQAARRLADLREKGLVRNGPERQCRGTGHAALTWEVTAAGWAAGGDR